MHHMLRVRALFCVVREARESKATVSLLLPPRSVILSAAKDLCRHGTHTQKKRAHPYVTALRLRRPRTLTGE
jgi:hypothetical protein